MAYLEWTGLRQYASTPGNRGALAVRRERDGLAEFLVLSLWESMEAVEQFAGPTPAQAVFYPEDDSYLVERDLHVDHYEALHGPRAVHWKSRREDGGSHE
jgi:heme-degrading monooxygenase HmoA